MKLAGKRVYVTGGAGLIGSFLVERLLSVGAHVIVADDFSKGRREHLAGVRTQIEIREGDLEQPDAMERALAGAEIVVHLASRAYGIGHSAGNHLAVLEHNERITNNLVHVLARQRPERLLIASSSCVYSDDGPEMMSEASGFAGEPETANRGYGWAKRFLEWKAQLLACETGTPLTIVRPLNIYGERYAWVGESSQAIPMLVKKVMSGDNPVVLWGSGIQRRNYIHAVDCADAIAGLLEVEFEGTVNIGTEDTVAVKDLAETICHLAGRHPRLVCDTTKPEGRLVKCSSSALLRRAYPGFHKSIDINDGLNRMLGWYRTTFSEASGPVPVP